MGSTTRTATATIQGSQEDSTKHSTDQGFSDEKGAAEWPPHSLSARLSPDEPQSPPSAFQVFRVADALTPAADWRAARSLRVANSAVASAASTFCKSHSRLGAAADVAPRLVNRHRCHPPAPPSGAPVPPLLPWPPRPACASPQPRPSCRERV